MPPPLSTPAEALRMQIVSMVLGLFGGLGMFMYGMELTSNGIQRAAGDRLQRAVNFMTANRIVAVITGAVLTVLVQSSSATSIMVVSFVNAGLLSLVQAIGVIMGANIGTTLTGWIIAAVGVGKFSIAALAVPVFGLGFFISIMKKRGDSFRSYGVALMGFAMIFLGLDFIAKAIPNPSGDALLYLDRISNMGFLSVIIAVLVGLVFTVLINASSATMAIVIPLAAQGILDFKIAAAITLGANIGTTFDAFLASFGSNVHGKRAAWAHIIFNIFGTVWVLAVFDPFLRLVDLITPGAIGPTTVGAHIAMLHTAFNAANTIVLLPLIKRYAAILERFFKDKTTDDAARIKPSYEVGPLLASPDLSIIYARKEIADLAGVARSMFSRFRTDLISCPDDVAAEMDWFSRYETYADEMKEKLSHYLLEVAGEDISERTQDRIGRLLGEIDDLENITDGCYSLAHLIERCKLKSLAFPKKQIERLEPYALMAEQFLRFVEENADGPITEEQLAQATEFENGIDELRNALRRMARKRIESGSDIKTELLFIDVVRIVEKVGDYAYSISQALRETR
jgi:phosphate:Na+ symporter